MPLVSVIIPTYNRAALLALAVQSVLNQTFTDFEIIVVDDGGADDSADVIARFDDSRIRYIRQANAGRSVARNRAMSEAKGHYISLLDDDDLFLKDKLALQVALLESHPELDGLFAGAEVIDGTGQFVEFVRLWDEYPQLSLCSFLQMGGYIPSTVIFRRRCLEQLDVWFDPLMSYGEDTDFFVRLLASGCHFDWLPEVVTAYRIHRQASGLVQFAPLLSIPGILDRLFTRTDLPQDVLREKEMIYASAHLTIAFHACVFNMGEMCRYHLEKSLTLFPAQTPAAHQDILEVLARVVQSLADTDQLTCVATLLQNLPDHIIQLAPGLREGLIAYQQRLEDM